MKDSTVIWGLGVFLITLAVVAFCLDALFPVETPDAEETPSVEDLFDAIEWVESRGDADAIGDNGAAVGAFQIHKIYVDDLNRIYKAGHTDKYSSPLQWEYYHRNSKPCSRTMVRDYLGHYATEKRIGRKPTFEDAARIHNGGPNGWKKPSTEAYWEKVKARMESVK